MEKVLICEMFGWTFEEYDNTDYLDLKYAMAVHAGYKKLKTERQEAQRKRHG